MVGFEGFSPVFSLLLLSSSPCIEFANCFPVGTVVGERGCVSVIPVCRKPFPFGRFLIANNVFLGVCVHCSAHFAALFLPGCQVCS